jgi:ribosomal protein S27AE
MTDERRESVGARAQSADGSAPADGSDTEAVSDAFSALAGETRLAIVQSLARDTSQTFSTLFDATDEDASAGFAYHLRQLTDHFVRQRPDERYELTDAGRSAVRAVRAGTFTTSVERDPIEVDDDCPLCGQSTLVATVADNAARVRCSDCDTTLVHMSFPPKGYETHDTAELLGALDTHYRKRVESFRDGVCPDCGGATSTGVKLVDHEERLADRRDDPDSPLRVQIVFDCDSCGSNTRCPVTLTLLDHPSVVSFYHDHDRDVRDRPVWNVGSEWREHVVSRDPWCVVVSARLDDEELILYVAGDGRVVDDRRHSHDDTDRSRSRTTTATPGGASGDSASERTDHSDHSRSEENATDGATA